MPFRIFPNQKTTAPRDFGKEQGAGQFRVMKGRQQARDPVIANAGKQSVGYERASYNGGACSSVILMGNRIARLPKCNGGQPKIPKACYNAGTSLKIQQYR